jgi:hypothetical protein
MFCIYFPHLKLNFFKKPHGVNEFSPSIEAVDESLSIEEMNPKFQEKLLHLVNSETVAEFEARMEKDYGLHVQVLRKVDDTWVQTTATDDWTLGKEEENGY